MAVLKKISAIMVLGLIFWVVSEGIFYGLPRSADSAEGYILTWLFYTYSAWLLLIVIKTFNIKTKTALFLAGGFFGWMIEGVLMTTTYGTQPDMPFPFSIVVTALSWHSLLTVMVGLYAMRMMLKTTKQSVILATASGIFFGLWAAGWRSGDPSLLVGEEAFFSYSFTLTALFAAGHMVLHKISPADLSFGKWEVRAAIVLTTLYFLFVTVPQVPISVFVLPVLLALLYFPLRKNQMLEKSGNLLATISEKAPIARYAVFLLTPCIATGIYTTTENAGNYEFVILVVTLVSGLLGLGGFVYSLTKLLRQKV